MSILTSDKLGEQAAVMAQHDDLTLRHEPTNEVRLEELLETTAEERPIDRVVRLQYEACGIRAPILHEAAASQQWLKRSLQHRTSGRLTDTPQIRLIQTTRLLLEIYTLWMAENNEATPTEMLGLIGELKIKGDVRKLLGPEGQGLTTWKQVDSFMQEKCKAIKDKMVHEYVLGPSTIMTGFRPLNLTSIRKQIGCSCAPQHLSIRRRLDFFFTDSIDHYNGSQALELDFEPKANRAKCDAPNY